MRVLVEIRVGQEWKTLGAHGESDEPGTLSSAEPGGRQVFMFGVFDGETGVWRSKSGYDVEVGHYRRVTALDGFEKLSDLDEPHEMDIINAKFGQVRVRFRRVE